jgi:hypothetical protein
MEQLDGSRYIARFANDVGDNAGESGSVWLRSAAGDQFVVNLAGKREVRFPCVMEVSDLPPAEPEQRGRRNLEPASSAAAHELLLADTGPAE